MPTQHSKATIISMAVIVSGIATLLHEDVVHGVIQWLRGDIPTELTNNHLSTLRARSLGKCRRDARESGVGAATLLGAPGCRSREHSLPLTGSSALGLLPGAGYFLSSGIFGFGD
jgi:hypothetical protein